MATIQSSGFGSGLDINSLVEQLVNAERTPTANRLTQREGKANTELSALGSFKSALAGFQGSLTGLKNLDTFQGRKVTVEDDTLFTAKAGTTALPGSYSVEVLGLATAHRLRSIGFPDATGTVGTGTLSITVNGATSQVVIPETAGSLNDIRNAINDDPGNPGVRATIVNAADGAHLIISAAKTGAANGIAIAVSGGDGGLASLAYDPGEVVNPMMQLAAAADASVVIDGFPVTSASNSISDAIEGVTIDLLATKPGSMLALTVDYDSAAAKESVQGFVTAYNKVIDTISQLTKYNPDTRDAAPLLGDATVRGVRDQMRRAISEALGTGDFRTLASVGITTQIDGKLSVDATKLSTAIDEDFTAVGRLFAGTSGLATRLDTVVGAMLGSGSTIATRESALKTTLKGITSQREALDSRMEVVQERLRKQFTAMDTLVGQLKNTSTYLAQQLG